MVQGIMYLIKDITMETKKKKEKKRKHGGDFFKVYIKSSSFHFWGKNAVLVLMDSKSKR